MGWSRFRNLYLCVLIAISLYFNFKAGKPVFPYVKISEGQLIAIQLKDKDWGLGQVLSYNYQTIYGEQVLDSFQVALYRHVKVKNLEEIDGDSISLDKTDIVFIITDDGFPLQIGIYKLLPFIREINVSPGEMEQDASVATIASDTALDAYFCLEPWYAEMLDDPKRNVAININGNIRPPNATLWVKPDPATIKPEPIYQYYLYFPSVNEMFLFCDEIEKLFSFSVWRSYPVPVSFKSQYLFEVMLSKSVSEGETLEELQDFLHEIAKRHNGFFDRAVPWPTP